MKIQDSELILNPDGSIYHLALQPDQVAPLILLVGDPDRVPVVSRHFDRMEYQKQKREFVTHTGWIGSKRLSVVSTGIGTDNIDIVLNELDALFNINLDTRQVKTQIQVLTFVRLGTAGSLQAHIPVDSVVASVGGIGFDGLLQFYQAEAQQQHPLIRALRAFCADQWSFPLAPYYSGADAALLEQFRGHCFTGYTATNPGFYGPQGRTLRAPARMSGYLDMLQQFEYEQRRIVNLEMETSAIYGLSALLGHRALSLSAILANRPLGQFSANPQLAVDQLVKQTLDILCSVS